MTVQDLKAHEATVTTATVEIKTLTIGRKQITLAVFRQIVDEDLIGGPDPKLLGVPWGQVNYHPDKCADDGSHTHVVWQKGDQLRRAAVSHGHPSWVSSDDGKLDSLRRLAVYRDIDETGVFRVEGAKEYGIVGPSGAQLISTRGRCTIWNTENLNAAKLLSEVRQGTRTGGSIFFDGRLHADGASARQAVLAWLTRYSFLPEPLSALTSEQAWAVFADLKADCVRRLSDQERIVTDVRALPQLFIAV